MEPLVIGSLLCLWVMAVCAVWITYKVWEVGNRFIEWTRGWERMWRMNEPDGDDEDQECFPGDEWKNGKNSDDEE